MGHDRPRCAVSGGRATGRLAASRLAPHDSARRARALPRQKGPTMHPRTFAALAPPPPPAAPAPAQETRRYDNRLTPVKDPRPLLADHPEWVEPIREPARYEAPVLVDDEGADLHVRA